ncbi:menaquinone-dependent protoporphyrinogen oxidase [Actinoplanes octamycinicus]|uniref:Menaquinone-dependent protoporphyrinogen oxidase n=1 Tax=Actinoplanes octamycinicus TaxID=135948 RepID=A0A7W7H2M9_9ACTN|nr:flavodoxin domain-containing protein [Actinoplanes octamycinicus]MBB4742825.1 menaquinone-dependent protoporphyrinogen oxidase [Actinoplanes octamycinicus]GIE58321.1 flavodoxin [Actinoplanes octamycinicus]
MTRILVAYATKRGSTQEVAEAVATAATAAGAQARVLPARAVENSLADWGLVILGAPIYSGRWHRDAHRFLARHRDELDRMPVAVFGLGPRRDDEEAWRRSSEQLERALARRSWLVPVSVGLFGGADPPGGRRPRRDLRDWAEIGDWTRKVLAMTGADGAGW